jgi:vitamin B12 transporter
MDASRHVRPRSLSGATIADRTRRLGFTRLILVSGSIAAILSATSATADPLQTAAVDQEDVEEMPVVGFRRPSMDVLAGASVSRVETEARLLEGAQIDDLLAEMPGVQIRRFGGIGERFEISIRGSRPEQVPVFLDGVRLDTSLTGRSDLSMLCLDVLEEIQVTRGAGAARAGSGAIGGVVNLVTRRAQAEPQTRLRLAGGSFDSVEGSLRHARRIGDWDTSLSYCGFRTEGDFEFQRARQFIGGVPTGSATIDKRINNEAVRHTGSAQIGKALGEGSLRVNQLIGYLDRGAPGLESNQRPDSEEHDLSSLTSLTLEYPMPLIENGHLEGVLSHRFERNQFEDEPSGLASEPINTRTEVHNTALRTNAGIPIDALGGSHELAFLVESRFDSRQSNEANAESRAGIALRVELETSWLDRRLRISPSLRMERVEGFETEWIPSILLLAEPFEWLELRSALARSYRVPSFQELYLPDKGFERGNPNLRPEEALSFEIGATLRSPFDPRWLDFEIEATWFAGEIDNAIAFQLISSNVLAPVNTGRSDTRGYELSVRWTPHDWIHTTATRSVTDAELEDSGARVAGIAVSQTDVRLELGPRERFKVVGELHYTGKLPLSPGGAAFLPSRTSYDASISVDLTQIPVLHLANFGQSLWLSLRGRNLGNAAIRDSRSFPRPGRNFSIAIESVF